MLDPIADMLTQIRNAQEAGKESLEIPFSGMKLEIGKILEKKGFIKAIDLKGRKTKKTIELVLQYRDHEPAVTGAKLISKQGQRVYSSVGSIGKIKRGQGIIIISTSKGLMTDNEARKENVGGEIICEIW